MNTTSPQSSNVQPKGAAPRAATSTEASDRLIRVLLVEDNPADVLLVNHVLESVGQYAFQIVSVERLQGALNQMKQSPPEIVLLDLSLPDSQGLETFSKFVAQAPGVPVIVLSGTDDEELAVQAVRQGAQDYVVKWSMEGSLLARVMRYAIERQHARDQLGSGRSALHAKDAEILELKKEINKLSEALGKPQRFDV